MAGSTHGDGPPAARSPRSGSPATARGIEESGRLLSPLRLGPRNETQDIYNPSPSDNAPKIMRSAATGSPLSPKEPSEFPFHAPGNANGGSYPTDQAAEVSMRASKPSSHMSNASSSSYYPPFAPVSRNPTEGELSDAPRERKSVQFARSATFTSEQQGGTSRQQSWEVDDGDGKAKERTQASSLIGKLRALASPSGHGRSLNTFAGGASGPEGLSPHGQLSPTSEHDELRFEGHDSEADADGESSAGEGALRRPRQKRRKSSRRWFEGEGEGTQTAPTTPKQTGFFSRDTRDSPSMTPTSSRPGFLRRSTMDDIPENERQGYSEDEGRSRIAKESAWTRGLHSARGLSYGGLRRHDPNADEEGQQSRPTNLRSLTTFRGAATADGQPSPWRMRSERTSSLSAQKWKSIKQSLKLLGNRQKAERQIDHAKSAELMAELLAGAPAALFLASMFQRDEHGHKRIPVLLEQLKVTITDSDRPARKEGDRHTALRIELEYGSGLTRMKWVVYRSVADFANLHLKFKVQEKQDAFRSRPAKREIKDKTTKDGENDKEEEKEDPRTKLPRFPRSVLPYLRGLRGYGILDDEEEEEEEETAVGGAASGPDGDASATERPARAKRGKSSFLGRRQ